MTEMKAIGAKAEIFCSCCGRSSAVCSEAPVANFNRKIQYPQLGIV